MPTWGRLFKFPRIEKYRRLTGGSGNIAHLLPLGGADATVFIALGVTEIARPADFP